MSDLLAASNPSAGVSSPFRIGGRAWAFVRANAAIVIVLALFAASAFIVPTLTPVATTDDWGYSRSVEILIREQRLTVFPVVAATAVFQIGWGAFFAAVFGLSLGVVRVATLVLVLCGALGLYGLLRELGVARDRSALGVAAYLFNPLAFVLGYTFMTDPNFAALLILATFGYVRGLRDRGGGVATVAGSLAASAALLTRQQGVLIPVAVVIFMMVAGDLRVEWRSLRKVLRIAGFPVLAAGCYAIWLQFQNDVPTVQSGFFDEARTAGWDGLWRLTRYLGVMSLAYIGFFVLPLAAAAIPGLPGASRSVRRPGWLFGSLWALVLLGGIGVLWSQGRRMPYLPQFMGAGGLGPPDVSGSRPRIFHQPVFDLLTVACAVAALIAGLLVCRAAGARMTGGRSAAGLIGAILVGQLIGLLPPSFHYLKRGFSLDRYLLPLLPLAICLVLWAATDVRMWRAVGWAVVALFAGISIAGTRDYLVYLDAVWTTAHEVHESGAPLSRIEAGAAWDGYHLYTLGIDQGITKARTRNGPWWVYFYGKPTDSAFVVSRRTLRGYSVISMRTYDQWLWRDRVPIYLLQRYGVAAPRK